MCSLCIPEKEKEAIEKAILLAIKSTEMKSNDKFSEMELVRIKINEVNKEEKADVILKGANNKLTKIEVKCDFVYKKPKDDIEEIIFNSTAKILYGKFFSDLNAGNSDQEVRLFRYEIENAEGVSYGIRERFVYSEKEYRSDSFLSKQKINEI